MDERQTNEVSEYGATSGNLPQGSYGEGVFSHDTGALSASEDDFHARFVRVVLNYMRKHGDTSDHSAALRLLGELNKVEGREAKAPTAHVPVPRPRDARKNQDGEVDAGATTDYASVGDQLGGSNADAQDVGTHSALSKLGGGGDAEPKGPLTTGGISGVSYGGSVVDDGSGTSRIDEGVFDNPVPAAQEISAEDQGSAPGPDDGRDSG